jgi:hypothetical protein
VIGKDEDYGRKKDEEYTAKHYHRPSDEFSSDFNLDGAVEDLKLLLLVGKRIASQEKWPAWKEGSEFREIRERSLK